MTIDSGLETDVVELKLSQKANCEDVLFL